MRIFGIILCGLMDMELGYRRKGKENEVEKVFKEVMGKIFLNLIKILNYRFEKIRDRK